MRLLLLLTLLAAVACSERTLVVANRLAPGGGEAGDGGTGPAPGPFLDIAVRIESDASEFNPGDILQLFVNGADRTDEVVIGGNYAVLRIDPAPAGDQFVELFRRTGPVLDTFTYQPQPFTGPTLTGTPVSGQAGDDLTLNGTGFDGGPLRVFFGGIEGTVVSSDATSVTATVPADARTGIVFVLVGADAAMGVVGFTFLDDTGAAVPIPEDERDPRLFAVMPGRGITETVIRIYGANLDIDTRPEFENRDWSRIFDIQDVVIPGIEGVQSAFAVIQVDTDAEAGLLLLDRFNEESNELPFTVE